ncbi:MAG: hypothetical protein FWD58_01835 [Firmicutes bacterium]|nr:hypothetical protein [Bacillota bacterium]
MLILAALSIPFCIVLVIRLNAFPVFIIPIIWILAAIPILYRHRVIINRIVPFLTDATELKADSVIIDSYYGETGDRCKIRIEFFFNQKNVIKFSGSPNHTDKSAGKIKARTRKTGYDPVFKKYGNRKTRILYSPTHNQVLILKDNAPDFKAIIND